MQNSLYEELFDLSGRVALVTGASKGLGRTMAECLARAGASVALCSRNTEDAESAATEIANATGSATFGMRADVAVESDITRLVAEVTSRFGQIDILVANAGINIRKDTDALTGDDWDSVLNINARGAFLSARAVLPMMRERKWGRIIFLGSILSFVGLPQRAAYCASKAAILGITRTMALEGAEDGVMVNAICPGPFATPINEAVINDPEKNRDFIQSIPVRRWGEPADIRGLTILLASSAAHFMTGAAYLIDGGWTAR